jgi:MFS family permease
MGISGLFGFGILYSFVPTKAQIAGLAAWQIGSILSLGALIFSLVSYTVGAISDRFGRRVFAIASQAIIVVAGLGLFWSEGFAALMLFYGLFCIGETITFLLSFVYASEVFERAHLGASMGAFDSVMDLSLFIGPILAISVYRTTGQIAPVFLIAVTPALLAFFATTVGLPKDRERDGISAEEGAGAP